MARTYAAAPGSGKQGGMRKRGRIQSTSDRLDDADMRILAELDLDSRKTASDIASAIGMTRQTVQKKIHSMERDGIILGYLLLIDFRSLGYRTYSVYLSLHNNTQEDTGNILSWFSENPHTWLLSQVCGCYDITAVIMVKDEDEFHSLWKDLKSRFRKHIGNAEVIPFAGYVQYSMPFTKQLTGNTISASTMKLDGNKITKSDAAILNILKTDPRMSLTDVSRKTGLSVSTIKYRLENMQEKGIILGYIPLINMERLGYRLFKVDFYLNSADEGQKLEKMIAGEQCCKMLVHTSGNIDLQAWFFEKSIDELNSMLDSLKKRCPGLINSVDILTTKRIVKGVPVEIR